MTHQDPPNWGESEDPNKRYKDGAKFVGKAAGKGAAKWGIGKIVALVLSGSIVLGGGGCGLYEATDDDSDDDRPTTSQQQDENSEEDD